MTTISSICPKCGLIEKSGKASCCGRGGSWFKNCGATGNTKRHHTWYEGIQVCKAQVQSKKVIGHQLNAAQHKIIDSSNRTGMPNKEVIAVVKTFTFTPSSNMSTPTPIITSASTLVTVQGCKNLLNLALHINLLVTTLFQ